MGSFEHTPVPFIWDFAQMITAILMIPSAFYLEKLFRSFPNSDEGDKSISLNRRILSSCFLISMLSVIFGMFMVGLFSEDRTTIFQLHLVGSYIVWSGFALTSIFLGLLIWLYPSPIPKPIGIYMTVFPPIPCIIFLTTFNKLSEWILMFSLITWIVPVAYILLKHINKEITSKHRVN